MYGRMQDSGSGGVDLMNWPDGTDGVEFDPWPNSHQIFSNFPYFLKFSNFGKDWSGG